MCVCVGRDAERRAGDMDGAAAQKPEKTRGRGAEREKEGGMKRKKRKKKAFACG